MMEFELNHVISLGGMLAMLAMNYGMIKTELNFLREMIGKAEGKHEKMDSELKDSFKRVHQRIDELNMKVAEVCK